MLDRSMQATSSLDIDARSRLTLLGLVVASMSLRLWGAFSDLPYIFHPDEPRYISVIQGIFKTGDLNPHFFNYPSMFLYINALGYLPYYFFGKLTGAFNTPKDILAPTSLAMGTTFTATPSSVIISRLLTMLFGTAAVVLLFFIGQRLTNKYRVGLLAALMLAISPSSVVNSRYITPDTYVVFWELATFLAATLILQQGKTWHYVLAGLSAGFTASSKYNGALIMLCVVAAHFLRYGWPGIRDYRLYLAALLGIVGFVLVTPFSILDSQNFLHDLQFEAQHYSTGHAGMEGNALMWYGAFLWNIEGIISLLAVVQVIRGLYLRSKATILIASFVVVYLAFISSYVVRNDRTILPAIPFLILLGAILLVEVCWPALFDAASSRAIVKAPIALLACAALATPLWNTAQNAIQLTTVNSRTTARRWVNSNLPAGARIGVESYAPFIDPGRFSLQGFGRMIDNPPDWYIGNGFEYLIFSQGMYGRYYLEPDKYPHEIALYNAFFNRFDLVDTFDDGGYEIRVYRVK